jgi:hypothetical protein
MVDARERAANLIPQLLDRLARERIARVVWRTTQVNPMAATTKLLGNQSANLPRREERSDDQVDEE